MKKKKFSCSVKDTFKNNEESLCLFIQCVLIRTGGSDGLSRAHGVGLRHDGLLGPGSAHHARLFGDPRAPLLLQLLLDFVDFLRQKVVILILMDEWGDG